VSRRFGRVVEEGLPDQEKYRSPGKCLEVAAGNPGPFAVLVLDAPRRVPPRPPRALVPWPAPRPVAEFIGVNAGVVGQRRPARAVAPDVSTGPSQPSDGRGAKRLVGSSRSDPLLKGLYLGVGANVIPPGRISKTPSPRPCVNNLGGAVI
jgi:hypothetical protein